MSYNFYGAYDKGITSVSPVSDKYSLIDDPRVLYDMLSLLWCADTCAPRMRHNWTQKNKTLGQCSITAFLTQDIFGGKVYGVLREGGNYHCYNVVGDCVFDLTSEQFGDEKLRYADNPEQLREVHFAKEEKRLRYEYLKAELLKLLSRARRYRILEIREDDYGCEELPDYSDDSAELMCRVLAEDIETGERSSFTLPDERLKDNGIAENSVITIF